MAIVYENSNPEVLTFEEVINPKHRVICVVTFEVLVDLYASRTVIPSIVHKRKIDSQALHSFCSISLRWEFASGICDKIARDKFLSIEGWLRDLLEESADLALRMSWLCESEILRSALLRY
ncbi:hypothetical protein ACTXT7_013380 [Hymenolepis weldensis]